MVDAPGQKTAEVLHRVRKQKSALKRELELFYTFVFGVFFGVLSSLMAIFWDAMVRGVGDYPVWYVITIFLAFFFTLGGLVFLFKRLQRERKDLSLMEENLEEMMQH